jgi:hypothetical protein
MSTKIYTVKHTSNMKKKNQGKEGRVGKEMQGRKAWAGGKGREGRTGQGKEGVGRDGKDWAGKVRTGQGRGSLGR